MQIGCRNKTKKYMCEDCNCITDSIECYEFRDKHRARTDINDNAEPVLLTDEKRNEIWERMINS